MSDHPIDDAFDAFAGGAGRATGHWGAFTAALILVLIWCVGLFFVGLTDAYQLVINTSTTIITFLMVFLIQSTQNRDAEAVQVKLDELLRVTAGAHNALLDLEELEERDLDSLKKTFTDLAEKARRERLQLHPSSSEK